MQFKPNLLRLGVVMAIAGLSPLAAQAVVISTQAQASADGVANPLQSSTATSGRVSSFNNTPTINGSRARSSASGDDSGFVTARASGRGTYSALGEFRFTDTVINSAFVPFTYAFDFEIDRGSLGGGVNSDEFGNTFALKPGDFVRAAYEIEILVNGARVWDSAANLTFDDNGTSFVRSGVDLGIYTPGSDFYEWESYTGSIDLGVLNPGEIINIEYLMRATAESNVGVYSYSCAGGGYDEGDYGGDDGYGGGEFAPTNVAEGDQTCFIPIAGSNVRAGDPFGPSGTPFPPITSAPVGQVPTPVPLGLIATSLLALGWQRRRKAEPRQ